jgi:hypothetical protein
VPFLHARPAACVTRRPCMRSNRCRPSCPHPSLVIQPLSAGLCERAETHLGAGKGLLVAAAFWSGLLAEVVPGCGGGPFRWKKSVILPLGFALLTTKLPACTACAADASLPFGLHS